MRKIVVDFWATPLHSEELGIKRKEVWRAKSKMFSPDMDIYGEIKFDDKKIGFIAYRRKYFEEKKLLVVRAFSENGAFLGSLEEIGVEEDLIYNVTGKPAPVFAVYVRGSKFFGWLRRIPAMRPELGEKLYLILPSTKSPLMLYLREKYLAVGRDWTVTSVDGSKIADVDTKVLDIGGKVEIKIEEGSYSENRKFLLAMTLFGALQKFYGKIIENIKERAKERIKLGLKPSKLELLAYLNPRRRIRI